MRVYRLLRFAGKPRTPEDTLGLIITGDDADAKKVTTAWSYALRYTARGLDVPDQEAALKMMLERHPSWNFQPRTFQDVWYTPDTADDDKPD